MPDNEIVKHRRMLVQSNHFLSLFLDSLKGWTL